MKKVIVEVPVASECLMEAAQDVLNYGYQMLEEGTGSELGSVIAVMRKTEDGQKMEASLAMGSRETSGKAEVAQGLVVMALRLLEGVDVPEAIKSDFALSVLMGGVETYRTMFVSDLDPLAGMEPEGSA